MGARTEALAKQFEGKAQEASAVFEKLGEMEWKKTTAAEQWTVGVVAHHVAVAHEIIAGIVSKVAAGQAMPTFTMDMLNAMNAQHAREHAHCTRAETLALHKTNAAGAATLVRGLSDADLAKSAVVLADMPAMSVEMIINGILIHHVDEHLGSIRATVGA